MVDDAELLRRYVQDRSEQAFTELVERHLSLVYHAALRRIGQVQLAEDATQYVFIAMARNAAALSRHAVLTGWLYTTTRFAANRILRVERRRQLREQEAYLMQNALSTPDLDWGRLRPALDGVMDQLSDRDRAAVLLRYFEGRSFADIGRALELTEDAARKRVERGVEKLRSLLGRRGIASTSAALAAMLSSQAGLAAPAGLAATVAGTAVAAGSSVLSVTTVGFLGLMSASKTILSVAGVVALLAVGAAGYEWRIGKQAQTALVREQQEFDLRSKHLLSLNERAALAENAAADALRSSNVGSPRAASPAWDPAVEGEKFLKAHPEAKPLVEKFLRSYMVTHYGPFFRSQGMSSAEAEQREEAMMKIQPKLIIRSAAGNLALSLDGGPSSDKEANDRIRDAMGDALYERYQDYTKEHDHLAVQQIVVDRVASDNYLTATPLSGDQTAQLMRILVENTSPNLSGTEAVDWDAIVARAREVLSPAQMTSLEVFTSNQAYQRALQAARQDREAAASRGAQSSPPNP